MIVLFKALSALLSYPTPELRAALDEISEAVEASDLIGPAERRPLVALAREIGAGDQLEAEERYCELFDRGRAVSLHLFEHLHGDSRDRGTAMVELKALYAKAGFEVAGTELPDFLPVLLEYLSVRDIDEAHELLADCAHILEAIARGLIARRSHYAAALQALLVVAGAEPVDAGKIAPARERPEALDRDWREEPAFGKASGASGDPARPN